MQTLAYVGLDKQIKSQNANDQPLINASGKEMDILYSYSTRALIMHINVGKGINILDSYMYKILDYAYKCR